MSIAVEKDQVVAGYVNKHKDGTRFTIDDIYDYIGDLWNAGCGPVRPNFTRMELKYFLDIRDGICLKTTIGGYVIDKSKLSPAMTEVEAEIFHNDENIAKSFDLFCKLRVNLATEHKLLDYMGFRFIYA